MKKKTNKLIYVLLGVATVLSAALMAFAAMRRKDLLEEGDIELADFSITMGIIGLVGFLVFAGIMALLFVKDKKTEMEQQLFLDEMKKTPSFARWFSKEEKEIGNIRPASRAFLRALSVPMLFGVASSLFMVLDGTSGALLAMNVFTLLFCLFVFWFAWWISDYGKQYVRPLLRSVSKQLPSVAEKEAFGEQLRGNYSKFSYQGGPQSSPSVAFVAEEYSYFRQFRKCQVIRNKEIDKAVLRKASYAIGMRAHFRSCYCLELYRDGGEKPFWCGYFHREEELRHALDSLKKGGVPEERVEDRIKTT